MLPRFWQEHCDRVILVSSPTHLPRCLRDACSLWLNPQHQPPPRAKDAAPTVGESAENGDITTDHGRHDKQGRLAEDGRGGEKDSRQREQRRWLPLVLASPSDTSYAGYGPDDVTIVEPPHRGDTNRVSGDGSSGTSSGGPDSAPNPVFPGDSAEGEGGEAEHGALVAQNLSQAEGTATPLLLLHDLVALALRVRKSSDAGFRKELQELLRRYVDT